ncbi:MULTISPECIES: TnsD family Tn7-like transposition protein [Bacillus cereus group]|uniref:TnsD family Tn7-like transposition protein n=1 Tax=Bacillus cereus group TaxID=86661 RepID=UPI0018CF6A08|nr:MULTISPECIES: TnsD family Tn7-like transposition protein [Bacillus cereus group]MBG9840061.1 Tn7 transposition protein D [Bacillus tropicus]MBG9878564.1 Tn7 transposition protein D [Bacillus tropicus]MBG9918417.1 Tn7 transposition protein D [Bacillus tropicus]MBJ8354638.1 transposase [Bacillus mycoides]MDA2593502.1 TnsD family transposase [Bacillus cereus group sp. Bc065]
MLPFFTNPYPDELIYSAIARYHFYSGNIDCKDTLEEVFQSRSVIPSVEIGNHFAILAQQIGSNYSVETILANHTIYPYYAMFLTKQRQQEILRDVVSNGQALYTRLGMIAGSICRKAGLYYCPECTKNDVEQFGEPYIHREHQLQGIDYCPHHEVQLRKYPVDTTSRIEYIRFELKNMNLSSIYKADPFAEISIHLSKQAYKLLQLPLHKFSREDIKLKYRASLFELNLITVSNRVRQKELYQAFKSKFPKGFLEKYESTLNIADEYNWLKVITRNTKRHVHPFRHLLMLRFLEGIIDDFVNQKANVGPFGTGPWPCLNKAATHYRESVIPNVEVTRDFKSTASIGTFSCSCGFVYARKGPDMSLDDRFRIGRVKLFGEVWKSKLKQLSKKRLSTRAIARELGVDSKTVKKYLERHEVVSNQTKIENKALLKQYRNELIEGIQKLPNLSRTALRERFKKQYMFLYRHDKEWVMKNLPIKQKKPGPTKRVDWDKRDREYVVKIKMLYKELLAKERPIRITISAVGKRLGILANLERHLDKLSQTKELLEEITESVEQFQIRRCCKVIDQMITMDEPVILWKVQRIAAVKTHHFHELKPKLEEYLQKKQDVSNDEKTTG